MPVALTSETTPQGHRYIVQRAWQFHSISLWLVKSRKTGNLALSQEPECCICQRLTTAGCSAAPRSVRIDWASSRAFRGLSRSLRACTSSWSRIARMSPGSEHAALCQRRWPARLKGFHHALCAREDPGWAVGSFCSEWRDHTSDQAGEHEANWFDGPFGLRDQFEGKNDGYIFRCQGGGGSSRLDLWQGHHEGEWDL